MKPRTREENFLAKIAGNASADSSMQPRTPEEYFLNEISGTPKLPASAAADSGKVLTVNSSGEAAWAEASSGLPSYTAADEGKVLTVGNDGNAEWAEGGGGLPSYTSADKGKFLGLGDGEESVTTVIVPEQTISYTSGVAPLTNADENYLQNAQVGDTAVMTVNGTDYECTATDFNGVVVFPSSYQTPTFMIGYINGSAALVYVDGSAGTYTVSLTRSVPSVEPKWENVGAYIINANAQGELDKSYNEIVSLLGNGKPAFVYMAMGGDIMFAPIVLAGINSGTYYVCVATGAYSATYATQFKFTASSGDGVLTIAM